MAKETESNEKSDKGDKTSPVMAQYLALKEQYPDCLLFYRMGDFYEMFFDDAIKASAALSIALTKRGKHQGEDIAMCGVPFHSYENYLARLIRQGFKVAICEQLENPAEAKKRGYKAIVKRDVVRLITPGTLTEDTLLDHGRNNFILSIFKAGGTFGLAWLDISTGEFYTQELAASAAGSGGKSKDAAVAGAALARLAPAEILVANELLGNPNLLHLFGEYKEKLASIPAARFNFDNADKRLRALFCVGTLEAFGTFSRPEICAAGVLVDYVESTQKGKLPRIEKPVRLFESAIMEIDAATRRNLEILEGAGGDRALGLLAVMDRTVSGAGARLLGHRLAAPLKDVAEINSRLDAVEFFIDFPSIRDEFRALLRKCPDIERALSRLSLSRGGPRDLDAIRATLEMIPRIKNLLFSAKENGGLKKVPEAVEKIVKRLGYHQTLAESLARALKEDDLPLLTREGGFVREGFSAELDHIQGLQRDSGPELAALQEKYARETGIAALRVKFNSVAGYFIEVPTKASEQMIGKPNFVFRQSVMAAARFSTPELAELENKIRSASERAVAMELEIFGNLLTDILVAADDISRTAKALAELDVAAGLADLAVSKGYCRPVLDDSLAFEISAGRHPAVEESLRKSASSAFIANDCKLGEGSLWLLTGPNMAGKSTFLRQNAIIAVMAQAGSYVPAASAHIGVIDKLFSRVGASDDLARGRSTFMVEMVETAGILNQATVRSFVILDEIGRGTATFDGLSIAWAVVEYLHEKNRSRALFATHYHELTSLTSRLANLSLHCMKIKEFNGEAVFLHEVVEGAADRSYGIHVAKLAGLPERVIARAGQVLEALEKENSGKGAKSLADELPLFAALAFKEPTAVEFKDSPAVSALRDLNPDDFSPKQALEKLYELKGLVETD